MDAGTLSIFRSLPPAELDASFERMVGQETAGIAEVTFALHRVGRRWLVEDAVIEMDGVTRLKLSTFVSSFKDWVKFGGGRHDLAPRPTSAAYEAGRAIGRMIVVLALAALTIAGAVALVLGIRARRVR